MAVGPVNLPVTRLFVEETSWSAARSTSPRWTSWASSSRWALPQRAGRGARKGIDIAPKYIPAEVFDKRAVEKNQVVFHDVALYRGQAHVKVRKKGNLHVAVELTDFSVFYSQDSIANAEATLKKKGSKIVVEKGQIVKVSKDKDGIVTREVLTETWTDWIDYWSVDFDFESKREIIRVAVAPEGQDGNRLKLSIAFGVKKSGPVITSSKTNGRASAPRRTARWN